MFLDEARLAFQVNSAHCVEILDVGSDGGVPYYVMPLVVGTPLSKLMARVAIAPRIAAEIAAQAALGLHDAHCARDARGELLQIVHRDVSPQNVLLDVDG
ncbi:MAG: serine/threonine protein kinase, partial [bacterium]